MVSDWILQVFQFIISDTLKGGITIASKVYVKNDILFQWISVWRHRIFWPKQAAVLVRQLALLCFHLDKDCQSTSLLETKLSKKLHRWIILPISPAPIFPQPPVGEYYVNGVWTPGSIDMTEIDRIEGLLSTWVSWAISSISSLFGVKYTQENSNLFVWHQYVNLQSLEILWGLDHLFFFLCFLKWKDHKWCLGVIGACIVSFLWPV